MFELIKIKLFGQQPVAKISSKLLDSLIVRDYQSHATIVRAKLKNLNWYNQSEKNRIAAGILKLADKDINALDGLIDKANEDMRDILLWAEYPGCGKLGFGRLDKKAMKKIFIEDFIEYSNWLNK